MARDFARVFLLSPAWIGGARSSVLLRPQADFDLALRVRAGTAAISEAYSFISGLYFRGKLAYAAAFASAPDGVPAAVIMVPGVGLVPPDAIFDSEQLQRIRDVAVDEDNDAYRVPLLRDAALLGQRAGPSCQYILLGSIATAKYTDPLLSVFGERLHFPEEFVGRGDMSRGGLMLRCAESGEELIYAPVRGAIRKGRRPAKLEPRRRP